MIWYFFAIFEKRQVSANQVNFYLSIPKNRRISPRAAKFSFKKNHRDLKNSVQDPNTLNLDPDPGFWPNLDPDPGLYNQF